MGTFKPASSWTQRLFLCVIKELPTGPQLRHKQTALCGYLNPCNFSFNTLTSVKSPAVTHSVGLVKRSHFLNKKTHNTYRNMADKLDLLVRYIGVLLLRAGQHYNKDANVCTHVGLCVFFLSNTHITPSFYFIARDRNQLLSLLVSSEQQRDCQHPYLTDRDRAGGIERVRKSDWQSLPKFNISDMHFHFIIQRAAYGAKETESHTEQNEVGRKRNYKPSEIWIPCPAIQRKTPARTDERWWREQVHGSELPRETSRGIFLSGRL